MCGTKLFLLALAACIIHAPIVAAADDSKQSPDRVSLEVNLPSKTV